MSPAEALIKFLREDKSLDLREIGKITGRDNRTIWGSYDRSLKKMENRFTIENNTLFVPVEIFSNRKYSVLENLVLYLIENNSMKIKEIAKQINKSQSTIWSVYNRVKNKGGNR